MRHHNLEHHVARPEPFTVEGPLAFILHAFGLPEDMTSQQVEDIFYDPDKVLTCAATGKTCVITEWKCVTGDAANKYTVKATPVPMVSKHAASVDPWVVVGTTTIDGGISEVVSMFNGDANRICDGAEPTLVGGRWLRPRGLITPLPTVAVVTCDIVRRQSEIDAEARAGAADGECRTCGTFDCLSTHGTCARCCDRAENPCPECGPHGNAGRVLLLESWVGCTTCRPSMPPLDIDGSMTIENSDRTASAALSASLKLHGFPDDMFSLPSADVSVSEGAGVEFKVTDSDGRSFMDARREALGALRASLIAEGASSEVAQQGVWAFGEALNKPTTRCFSLDPKAIKTQVHFASGRSQVFGVPLGCNEVEVDDSTETVTFGVAGSSMVIPPTNGFFRLGETDDEYRQRIRSHFDPVGHKPGSFVVPAVAELANYVKAQREATVYVDGDRVVDRWGRRGVVLGMSGKLVRVKMDEGWTGLHAVCELVGKADG